MTKRLATPTLLAAFLLVAPGVTPVLGQAPTVEAQLGTSIVDRMPQGTATSFPAAVGEVYCWMRITGAANSTVTHVWIHDGTEYPVQLNVGGSPWRTWSSKVIPPEWAGQWRVEVRGANGTVLQTLNFTVG